jgi:RecA/RadA recombinase
VLDDLESAIDSGKWDLVVLDSIGGLLPRTEAEKGSGEKTIGGQAGIVARFSRKIVPLLAMHNVALVVINHSFVDLMSGRIMTSGGKKLSYHKSLSIRLKSTGKYVKVGDNIVSKYILGQVKKNKLAPTEGREETAELVFGKGFSAEAKLFQMAIDAGVITKTGNSYFMGERKLGVGQTKAREAIEGDEELKKAVEAALV